MIDYDELAGDYAQHRTSHPEVVRALISTGGVDADTRVLEIGCGTGNYVAALREATGCDAMGTDPNEQMLAQARRRTRGVRFECASAEDLIVRREAFDLIFSVDVIHHLRDHGEYFRRAYESLCPGGRLCTATDSPEIIRTRCPLAVYWPGTIEIDLDRYPPLETLRDSMQEACFRDIEEARVEYSFAMTTTDPYEKRAFSCLQLISDQEFLEGLERLRGDIQSGTVRCTQRYHLLWGAKPAP